MNKAELVMNIAQRSGISAADAQKAINAFTDIVLDECAKGGEVRLVGFGVFSVREAAERQGRNPQTGKPVTIPACRVPKFTAGAKFKEVIAK